MLCKFFYNKHLLPVLIRGLLTTHIYVGDKVNITTS